VRGNVFLDIQLGNWQANLLLNIPNVEKTINYFKVSLSDFVLKGDFSTTNNLIVVSANDGRLMDLPMPSTLSKSQTLLWEEFTKALEIAYRQFDQSNMLKGKDSSSDFTFAWSRPNSSDWNNMDVQKEPFRFNALVLKELDENVFIIIFGYLLFLAVRWHIEHSELCIHSSAVARGQDGFLFLGKSEAGKTTVARLSASLGYIPLGDDINFILCSEKKYRLASAPSLGSLPAKYSMLCPPLRGMFTLVQDNRDGLISLQPVQVAKALFNAFLQETPHVKKMSHVLVGLGFKICCDIARHIPGYELHFRKSPDFWKLIDEQFPD
jgi:hypothetical protein